MLNTKIKTADLYLQENLVLAAILNLVAILSFVFKQQIFLFFFLSLFFEN
jgi:hypothetical protein